MHWALSLALAFRLLALTRGHAVACVGSDAHPPRTIQRVHMPSPAYELRQPNPLTRAMRFCARSIRRCIQLQP